MKTLIACCGILFGITVVASAMAEEPREQKPKFRHVIPLDQIWGYDLPGTRDIAGISLPDSDPHHGVIARTVDQFKRQREFNIEQFRRAIATKLSTTRATNGFAIPRQTDFFALERASTLVTMATQSDRKNRSLGSDTFRVEDEITLAFFSHPASYYLRLREAKREDNAISITYEFEPHSSPEVTVHFAFIPLGRLPAGEYQVHFRQIPLAQKYRDAGFVPVEPAAPTIVCGSFTFRIVKPSDPTTVENSTVIPLDQIWGYDLPHTRDVRELEPKADPNLSVDELTRRLAVWRILKVLKNRPKKSERAGPAFVVAGRGKEALKNAEIVFSNGVKQRKPLPSDTDVSLVFYSHMCGQYVRLVSVEWAEKVITVKYQFVPHQTGDMSTHFALIPLGKLSEGDYQVKIVQVETTEPGRGLFPLPYPERIVSNSFSFTIQHE